VRLLQLREFEPKRAVPLRQEQVDDLRQLCRTLRVQPTVGQVGHYDLTVEGEIGAINVRDLAVEIRPKLDVEHVFFILSYALDPKGWRPDDFTFGSNASLVEAIVFSFATHVDRALKRGLLHGYLQTEESIATIRGRLRFDEQIRRRLGRAPPFEVRYEDYTPDVTENRLIKAAVGRLGRMYLRLPESRARLRRIAAALDTVTAVPYDPRLLPDLVYTRLNQHYRAAVELAKLIIRSTTFDLTWGPAHGSAFLVDMKKAFENFVVIALREDLGVSQRDFPQGSHGMKLHLDEGSNITLQPDLSWWMGGQCHFVGDVKYKRVNVEGVQHPDVYQVLAYAVAANLPGGLLIYAAGEAEPVTHRVRYLARTIDVIALDLSVAPKKVLEQASAVAQRIRSLAQASHQTTIPAAAAV